MTTLKQGRWVKIHEQGRANFETAENVMGITFGDNRYQAEATYTAGTRTYRKAAYWMLRYLGHAKADEILALAAEEIQAKAAEAGKDASEVVVSGEGWTCKIEKMAPGVFKTEMTWTVAAKEKPAPKKRGRRKNAAATA
ncbi:hypothetical protein [Acutalibacter muris]|uniref:hypothetical protein n=1 Tax=Acutalibacter muris TaxID=1796620 RepID=UPI00272E528F|nr:hypothetical protein [Acutalibacter muris]